MSDFKHNLAAEFRGEASLESGEVSDAEYTPTVSESPEFTEDDIDDVYDERYAVDVNREFLPSETIDCRQLNATASVINVLGQAVQTARTISPAVAQSFVGRTNCIAFDTSKILGVEVPRLENEDDGSISDVSMEGMSNWFETAKNAFRASVGPFFARMTLTLSRLSSSSKGLANRCARIRAKAGSRKGNGGKDLKLNSKHLELLILGDNYAVNPLAALGKFSELTLAIGEVVEQYHARVDKMMKAKIFDALANVNGNSYVFSQIDVSDLRKQLSALIAEPNPLLLGNTKYVFQGTDATPLYVGLEKQMPSADGLVKHLPAPKSLSPEDVTAWVTGLESLIGAQMSALERLTANCTKSFQNVKSALEKVNYSNYDDKDEPQLYDVDTIALLRLETQVVNEIGTICNRLANYQANLVDRLDAALVVVEESLFQD